MSLKSFFESYAETESKLEFKMASELNETIPSISSGSYLIDDMIGCNGYPLGRIIQLYGPAGSGKSLLSLLAIKEAQKLDPTAEQLYIDAESTYNSDWSQKLGCNLNKIGVLDSEMASSGQQLFQMLLGQAKEDKNHFFAGYKKEGLLQKIAKKEANINLIVLDSLGAIQAPTEETSLVGKQNISPLPRFLGTVLKKLSLQVKQANIPFIIINHKKDGMDPYGPDHNYSGGNTLRHALSANLYIERVNRADSRILNDNEEIIGSMLRVTLEKSKFSPWPRKTEVNVDFSKGFIKLEEEISQLALKYEVVAKPTSMSYVYEDYKWVGEAKFLAALQENQDLQQELIFKIKEKQNLNKNNTNVEEEEDLSLNEESLLDVLTKKNKKK